MKRLARFFFSFVYFNSFSGSACATNAYTVKYVKLVKNKCTSVHKLKFLRRPFNFETHISLILLLLLVIRGTFFRGQCAIEQIASRTVCQLKFASEILSQIFF